LVKRRCPFRGCLQVNPILSKREDGFLFFDREMRHVAAREAKIWLYFFQDREVSPQRRYLKWLKKRKELGLN